MRPLTKLWQRWVLDAVLTNPPPLIAVVLSVFLSVFAVGFWCAHWLDQVDLAAYRSLNIFTDNIKGTNLLEKMSSGLPIDVVYTWVNGSDPRMLQGLIALSGNSEESCPLSHCLHAPYISLLASSVPKSVLESLPNVVEVGQLSITHDNRQHNFTVVRVSEESHMQSVLETIAHVVGNGSQPEQVYWTSDIGGGWGMKQQRAVLVTGADGVAKETLLISLFPQHSSPADTCWVSGSSAVQVIECKDEGLISTLLQSDIDPEIIPNKHIKVRQAMLMLRPDRGGDLKEIDINRFEDNEELRYSLRSLEKYAPWVRRIFIVSNGQIPYWLNLDHPRLTIITHDQIFINSSHLPTYSSPAIESHIHRIPGLSEHFLYLNDDVMLGSEVWPEDFYSPSTGYKVYLSWTLPECSSGCPGSWLGDGYCDASCNTSSCEWDGGDCTKEKGEGGMLEIDDDFDSDLSIEFCAPSCSDLWIADKYCDNSCNVEVCGFDGGDCGLERMDKLHELPPPKVTNTTYIVPKGVHTAWMNISSLLLAGKNVEGRHSEHQGLRSLIVNTAQGILFMLLKTNVTTTLYIELQVSSSAGSEENTGKDSDMVDYFLAVKCNTFPTVIEIANKTTEVESKPVIIPKNFTFHQVSPKIIPQNTVSSGFRDWKYALVNVNSSKLPSALVEEVLRLEGMFREGDLTFSGLKRKKSRLIEDFMKKNANYKLLYHSESEWYSGGTEFVNENGNIQQEAKDVEEKQVRSEIYSGMSKMNRTNLVHVARNITLRTLLWSSQKEQDEKFNSLTLDEDFFYDINSSEESAWDSVESPGTLSSHTGNLPWEKQNLFPVRSVSAEDMGDYEKKHSGQRQLLDMFAESLLHVNRLYNTEFGYQARRVPAHMPHLINKNIMESLQSRFHEEFKLTSSHKIRQPNDMQYAFSYFFYVMSKKRVRTPTEVFESFDTDNSGTLSDREIRTFLSRINDLPLHYSIVQAFHKIVINCSLSHPTKPVPTPIYERYSDSELPTVSLELVLVCEPLTALMKKLENVHEYKYSQSGDEVVHFKMVTSNVSIVVHMLDEVRKSPRKFICLNSNLDPKRKENDLVRALVQDTYESLFPVPSAFELPLNYRNRFLYMEELWAWRKWRDFIRALIYACLASLIFLTLINFFSTELENLRRRWCRRRRRRDGFGGVRV